MLSILFGILGLVLKARIFTILALLIGSITVCNAALEKKNDVFIVLKFAFGIGGLCLGVIELL
jgi:hypothetical protein